jgi:hypothetical protein
VAPTVSAAPVAMVQRMPDGQAAVPAPAAPSAPRAVPNAVRPRAVAGARTSGSDAPLQRVPLRGTASGARAGAAEIAAPASAAGPAEAPSPTAPPAPGPGGGPQARPAPTRAAVAAAFQQALRPQPAPAISPPPATPAPARAAAVLARSAAPSAPALAPPSPWSSSPLSRVETAGGSQGIDAETKPAAEPVDLDALADFVLERLRHELRDGRERLGFLLDDSR